MICCAARMRGVLDDHQIVAAGKRIEPLEIDRISTVMNGNDRLGSGRYERLRLFQIDIQGSVIDVHDYRRGLMDPYLMASTRISRRGQLCDRPSETTTRENPASRTIFSSSAGV